MIDFAGLVGRFTGKGALDAAATGASATSGAEAGIATGGQFAALVNLAAALGADRDQPSLRLVVDNGAAATAGGTDAATTDSTLTTPGLTAPAPVAVIDPVMSGKIAGWTSVTGNVLPAPRMTDVSKKPVATVQSAMPRIVPDGIETIARPNAALTSDTSDETATGTPSDKEADASTPDGAITQNIVAPQPAAIDPQAAAMTVALPAAGRPDVPPITEPAQTGPAPTTPFGTRNDRIAGAWKTRWAPTELPVDPTNGEPLAPDAIDPAVARAIPAAAPKTGDQGQPMTRPAILTTPLGETTPLATPAATLTAPVVAQQVVAPQVVVVATAQPVEPAADVASAAQAIVASGQPTLKPAIQTPMRSRATQRAASAEVTATPADTKLTDDSVRPAASSPAKSAESAPAFASSTVAVDAPFRAIVDALPPVIQSELATGTVRAASGPSTGQALGDQVIDMGVSGQWIDRMAREIAGLADGTGHSRFTLNPPHLGRLQVDLWQDGGATNVRLMTETDEAAQRLSDGRSALQADARVAALSLGTITVEKSSSSFDQGRDQPRDQQRQGGDLSGQMQQQANGGQAQGRAGNGSNNQGSDWVRRAARDDTTQTSDATAREPAQRAANGRVRFA